MTPVLFALLTACGATPTDNYAAALDEIAT